MGGENQDETDPFGELGRDPFAMSKIEERRKMGHPEMPKLLNLIGAVLVFMGWYYAHKGGAISMSIYLSALILAFSQLVGSRY